VILRVGGEMRETITRELARKQSMATSVTTAQGSFDAFDWVI
jgi:hypothetical protein